MENATLENSVFGYLMLWRSHLLGVPIYWAFPVNGRSHLMGGPKETIRRRLSEETIRGDYSKETIRRSGAHDIFGVAHTMFFGVAHTIFCGVAHTIFCGARTTHHCTTRNAQRRQNHRSLAQRTTRNGRAAAEPLGCPSP